MNGKNVFDFLILYKLITKFFISLKLLILYFTNPYRKFNIEAYLEQTVLADLQTVTNPFLLGRSLWFAGRFADKIRAELINQFLTATVAGLGSNQHIIVRIQASRAVFEFISKMAGKFFSDKHC